MGIISSAVALGGAALGAASQYSAAKKSAKASSSAANATLAENKRQYDTARADQMPFIQSGYKANNAFSQSLGLAPTNYYDANGALVKASENYDSDPLAGFYQSGYYKLLNSQPIINNTNAAFSAKGMGLDGSAIKGLHENITKNQYGAFADYQGALTGNISNSQSGVSNLSGLAQNYAASNANTRTNLANSQASSYQNQANILNQGLGNIFSMGTSKGWW